MNAWKKERGKGGKKKRKEYFKFLSRSAAPRDLASEAMEQWEAKCPGNEPAFLALHYLEALQVRSGCGAFGRVSWWVTGSVVRRRRGCVAEAPGERLANSRSKLSTRGGSFTSPAAGTALVCEAFRPHAGQPTEEIRAGGGECWGKCAGQRGQVWLLTGVYLLIGKMDRWEKVLICTLAIGSYREAEGVS